MANLNYNCIKFGVWFVLVIWAHLIFYIQILHFWLTNFTNYWTFFSKWFIWSLILTLNIVNFKNSYRLVANQTNWQGLLGLPMYLIISFYFFFIVCGPDKICPRALSSPRATICWYILTKEFARGFIFDENLLNKSFVTKLHYWCSDAEYCYNISISNLCDYVVCA